MARIDYDERTAAAFQAGRQLPPAGLGQWRAAITRHLAPVAGMRILDLGAGTGMWAAALASWYDISVVAVEPSAAMRARSSCPAMIGGDAMALPLGAATMDGAWLSTVVHHLPDLPAAARELARVLRPGAPVLIRSAFAGRCQHIGLVRYWPETAAVLDSFPTVTQVRGAFETAGFSCTGLESVPQVTASSLAVLAAASPREAHTPLTLISDAAYQAGLARLRAAASTDTGPVIDTIDLLVLHNTAPGARDGDDAPSRVTRFRCVSATGSVITPPGTGRPTSTCSDPPPNGDAEPAIHKPETAAPVLASVPRLIGVVNLTEDSFSDGGLYLAPADALAHARQLRADGADIIELGPAASHPDATPVSAAEQQRRLFPVLDQLAADGIPVSVDTLNPQVQRFAVASGAAYLNDIQGFPNAGFYPALAASGCRLIVMHSVQSAGPATRVVTDPTGIWASIEEFFTERLAALQAGGIGQDRLIIDPGLGYFLGSNPEPSLAVLARIRQLKETFGIPVVVSPSRKSFLRAVTGRDIAHVAAATLAAEIFAAWQGADYIRTHDVAAVRDALTVLDALTRHTERRGNAGTRSQ